MSAITAERIWQIVREEALDDLVVDVRPQLPSAPVCIDERFWPTLADLTALQRVLIRIAEESKQN